MGYIAIGGDVSKGRLDLIILNQSQTQLHRGSYDDTAVGHQRLQRELATLRERFPKDIFLVGVEATGGLEKNWLVFFRHERRWLQGMQVHRLSPLQVKRYLSDDLHRAVTDDSAAFGIARFLLERLRERAAREDEPSPAALFYRQVRGLNLQRVQVQQRLQSLLPQVQPELVHYCRQGFPQWVLSLLEAYPTAEQLAAASPEKVAKILYITPPRAAQLVAGAKQSVAGLKGPATALSIKMLVGQHQQLTGVIDQALVELEKLVAEDPLHREQSKLLDTITGFGLQTSITLSLEAGDLNRFSDVKAFIAWVGLDPHLDQSGDGQIRRGISHRGNAHIRAAMYMPTRTAIRWEPHIKAFYERLSKAGKPDLVAVTACMHKLLRIAFAVVRSKTSYDRCYEEQRSERLKAAKAARLQAAATTPQTGVSAAKTAAPAAPLDLTAPVTRREAKRRKERNNAAARALLNAGSSPKEDERGQTAHSV